MNVAASMEMRLFRAEALLTRELSVLCVCPDLGWPSLSLTRADSLE